MFAAEGLGVSLDEIARRAGVGPGTVHRHFPAKEALYLAVAVDADRRDDGGDHPPGEREREPSRRSTRTPLTCILVVPYFSHIEIISQ